MKKLITILLVVLLAVPSVCMSEAVVQKRISVTMNGTEATGVYTGELNENGNPDGFGVFCNTYLGVMYYMIGQWTDGVFSGQGWKVCADGMVAIGFFESGNFVFGNYFAPSVPKFYSK